jgi:hypothetical protein
MPVTRVQVVFDCANPSALGAFWVAALGYQPDPPPQGFATWQDFLRSINVPESEWNSAFAMSDPEGVGPRVFFQRVPEGKTIKNRVHLDLNVGGGRAAPLDERKARVEAEAQRLVALGATRTGAFEERGGFFVTMLDPEGNEFDLQ